MHGREILVIYFLPAKSGSITPAFMSLPHLVDRKRREATRSDVYFHETKFKRKHCVAYLDLSSRQVTSTLSSPPFIGVWRPSPSSPTATPRKTIGQLKGRAARAQEKRGSVRLPCVPQYIPARHYGATLPVVLSSYFHKPPLVPVP